MAQTIVPAGGILVPFVTVEAIIDAGGWNTLTPEQQAKYDAEQAAQAALERTWRGRRAIFAMDLRRQVERFTPHIHLGPCPTPDDYA